MNIEISKNGTSATLSISGRLDTITAPSLDKVIAGELDGVTELTLDMKELEYISSAGLRVLLGAEKKMSKVGSMKLVSVNDDVMDVLEMTGFADILTIE